MGESKALSDRRNHIKVLLERDNMEHQDPQARLERRKLNEMEPDYPMCLELDFFAHDIRPAASSIVMRGTVNDPQLTLEWLQKRTLFGIDGFAEWYFDGNANYPKTKANADTLEYIRLLAIEYINLQMQST